MAEGDPAKKFSNLVNNLLSRSPEDEGGGYRETILHDNGRSSQRSVAHHANDDPFPQLWAQEDSPTDPGDAGPATHAVATIRSLGGNSVEVHLYGMSSANPDTVFKDTLSGKRGVSAFLTDAASPDPSFAKPLSDGETNTALGEIKKVYSRIRPGKHL